MSWQENSVGGRDGEGECNAHGGGERGHVV